MNGAYIFISLGSDSSPIAGTKTDEIQVGCDTIEVASLSSNDWKEFLAGRKEWTVNVNWLVTSGVDVQKLLYVGQTYTLSVLASGSAELTGSAICTNAHVQASLGNLANGSFTFKGTGALTSN